MKVAIFVQARMGSSRLPGKVLMPILGKPMLKFQIERLKEVKLAHQLVVLTTDLKLDDSIAVFCKQENVLCYRGSEEDVLDRYYQAALYYKADVIVRVTADCPLIDPAVIDQVIDLFLRNRPDCDYASNTLIRSFPRGLDVEVMSFKALKEAFLKATLAPEREHVTYHIYTHPEKFCLENLELQPHQDRHRWTVDTPEDFKLVQMIFEAIYNNTPCFGLNELLDLLKKHPDWSLINTDVEQKKI